MVDSFKLVGLVAQNAAMGESFIYDPVSVLSRDRLWRIVMFFSVAIVLATC